MNAREKAYNKKIAELVEATGRLTEREIAKALALLETARTQVAARIAETDWQMMYIPQLQNAINEATDLFSHRYGLAQKAALANIFEAGIDMIDGPLRTAGIWVDTPAISSTALEIMQGYSVDLIGGVSSDMRKKITGEISMGILGGKTPHQVMEAIGKNLEDKSIFASIATRAETITRTEMGRVNSLARAARSKATIEANPGLPWRKKWHASGKAHPRPIHQNLNMVEIDYEQKFLGYIDYPHAPGLALKEVVNCGCTHTLTTDWDRLPNEWQTMPYQHRAIYD